MKPSEYRAYLASREWAVLKVAVRERSGGKCERCKVGSMASTHHLTYERIGRELLSDLLGVCEECHEYLSGKSDTDPALTTAQAVEKPDKRMATWHMLYGYRLPWMDFWYNTLSVPFDRHADLFNFCITQMAEMLSVQYGTWMDEPQWDGDAKFGAIPHGDYPVTIAWAGRSLHYDFCKRLGIRQAVIIVTPRPFSWLGEPVKLYIKDLGEGDITRVELAEVPKDEREEFEEFEYVQPTFKRK